MKETPKACSGHRHLQDVGWESRCASNWQKHHAIHLTNAAVSPATSSSESSASIASSPTPLRAKKIAPKAKSFLAELKNYLRDHVDADEIDRTGEIPQKNIEELFAMGAFGVKIPQQYEGLGLSQVNYGRAAMLLGSWDANLTALVSAHQSIGVPQPLLLFGTEEQKKKYLPRVARREISAFALTEWNAGSDPANMSLRADPTEDGSAFILNGEKLWCTNLIKAGVLVVMAKTPPKDRERQGAQTDHRVHCRCRFARARDHLSLSFHGIARALQRHREVHQRAGAARKHDREGRSGIEGCAHNVEYRPAHDSGGVRRFVEATARDLPQMGQGTRAMGRADRSALRHRREKSPRWRATFSRWKRSHF